MIDMKELKDAKEVIGSELFTLDAYLKDKEMELHHNRFRKMIYALKIFYSLAEQVLSEKVPERAFHLLSCPVQRGLPETSCNCGAYHLNLLHDQFTAFLARDYVHRDKLPTKDEIEHIINMFIKRCGKGYFDLGRQGEVAAAIRERITTNK